MAVFVPFKAVRPQPGKVGCAVYPYDVISPEHARELAKNPDSFIHVEVPEADLPDGAGRDAADIYAMAADQMQRLLRDGLYLQEDRPCFYVYREICGDLVQTGLIGCAAAEDYERQVIHRHEYTVREKEEDRTRHLLATKMNTGSVFLFFEDDGALTAWMQEVTERTPLYDYTDEAVVRQSVWRVDDPDEISRIEEAFGRMSDLYIADGHHRCASAVSASHRVEGEQASRFMATAFPADPLHLLAYHRVVRELGGRTPQALLDAIGKNFDVEMLDNDEVSGHVSGRHVSGSNVPETAPAGAAGDAIPLPEQVHRIHMNLDGHWYALTPRTVPDDPVSALDVSILQDQILEPIFGITDPRADHRLCFIGGQNAAREVADETRQCGGVGFLLYPTAIRDVMTIAGRGSVMPPKSTWFEPKLMSGLIMHCIEE